MHYNWRPLFLSLVLPILFGNEQLAPGGRIPSRTNLVIREDASKDMVEVPGLRVLQSMYAPMLLTT